MVVQITTVFPSIPHMQSASCPGVVTGLHILYCHVSVTLCWLLASGPDQEAHTTGVLLTIGNTIEYILRLTYVPPFPASCPGPIR